MKCLLIGGAHFLGVRVLDGLFEHGHDVHLFCEEGSPLRGREGVEETIIQSDDLTELRDTIEAIQPDVAIHMTASSGEQGLNFLKAVDGIAGSMVVLSNANVYAAHAYFRGTEDARMFDTPIGEATALRAGPLDEDGKSDYLGLENAMKTAKSPTTILRLPPIYGPDDPMRRFYPQLIRMIAKRPQMMVGSVQAEWRWTHGYVDDVAHGIVIAATRQAEESRIYNLGEKRTPTMRERLDHLSTIFEWEGEIVVVPEARLPSYMQTPGNFSQDLEYDTSAIRNELDFKEPTDYYDGLDKSIVWYVKHPPRNLKGKEFSYAEEDLALEAYRTREPM